MKKQVVVRTKPIENGTLYPQDKMKSLRKKLDEGYIVVMCNPIGKDLEYILEREVDD